MDLPKPVEVDPQISTTGTSHLASMTIDIGPLAHPAFGSMDSTYGLSTKRPSPERSDSQMFSTIPQNRIAQWYENNDGPWIPKGLSDFPVGRPTFPQSSYVHRPFETYRQLDTSDIESVRYPDSGYGTRKSVGNASIFSGEFPDRDQDCGSIAGRIENFQPFQGIDELESIDDRIDDPWPLTSPVQDARKLFCRVCHKEVRTPSELKYNTCDLS